MRQHKDMPPQEENQTRRTQLIEQLISESWQIPQQLMHDNALYELSIFIFRMQEDTLQRVWAKAQRDSEERENPRTPLSQGEFVTLLHYCVNIFIKKRDKDAPLLQPDATFPFVRPMAETFLDWYRDPPTSTSTTTSSIHERRRSLSRPPANQFVVPFDGFKRSFSTFLSEVHNVYSARPLGTTRPEEDMKENPTVLNLTEQNIRISLSELSQFISSLPLETLHAVWERVEKNRDGVVGDTRSLLLLLHVFFCLKIKEQRHDARYPDPNDEDYLRFMQRIVDCLSINFASREIRERLAVTHSDFILEGSTSRSEIVVGFEDLVETMPSWLQAVSNMLSQSAAPPRHSLT